MKKIIATSALLVTASLLLSGCGIIKPLYNGQDEKTIADQVSGNKGIESAEVVYDDTESYDESVTLTVNVKDGWYVADTAKFADYLVHEAWSFKTEPDNIYVVVNGGVPDNFDWYDSLVDSSPSPEWSTQTVTTYFEYPEPHSGIGISNPGYILTYGDRSPGYSASLGSDVLKEGAVPEVEPSAVLNPKATYNANSDVKSFAFTGFLNNLENEPYTGTVSVSIAKKDGTVIAEGTPEVDAIGNHDGELTIELPWAYDGEHADTDRVVYYFTVKATPQDGYNTEDRTYPFIVIRH